MDLSIQNLIAIFLIQFVVLAIAWLLSGRMRIALETLLLMSMSQVVAIIVLILVNPEDFGSFFLVTLIPALFLIIYSSRFNALFKKPYSNILENQLRIVNAKDISTSAIRMETSYTGEMMALHETEKISLMTINDIINKLRLGESAINSLGLNISKTAKGMGKEVSELTNNIDEILQSGIMLGDFISQIKNNMYKFAGDLRKQFNSISVALNTTERISEQTNLIAVNAAIEAVHTGALGENFGVVADGIQKLSSQTKKSTEKLYKSTKLINEQLKSELEILMSDIDKIDDINGQILEISNKASTFSHSYQMNTQKLIDFSNLIQENSQMTLDQIQDYVI